MAEQQVLDQNASPGAAVARPAQQEQGPRPGTAAGAGARTPRTAQEPRGELRRKVITVALGAAFLGAVFFMIHGLLGKGLKPHKTVQEITLLRPPPPPPPPKPEEKPPEPELKKEEVKIDPPKDQPKPDNEPPPALKPLGVDADASGGSDGFGLASNKGGRDITTTAGMTDGPGGNGGPFIGRDPTESYNRKLKGLIQDALSREKALQGYNYTVQVALTPRSGGGFSIALRDSTGDATADAALQTALERLSTSLPSPPNASARLLRITSRS